MADRFGNLTLPTTTPVAGQPAGDPAIYYLGTFCQAVLNADAAAAWTAVCPGKRLVEFVWYHEPDEMCFADRWLPALFLWREKSERAVEWLAEDILQTHDLVQCCWVLPATPAQETSRVRHPAINAHEKALARALSLGVNSAWTVTGDASPDPTTGGSVIYRWAGLDSMRMGPWQRKVLTVPLGDGRERALYGTIEWTIRITEGLYEDITRWQPLNGINLTIKTPAPTSLTTEYLEFRPPSP